MLVELMTSMHNHKACRKPLTVKNLKYCQQEENTGMLKNKIDTNHSIQI